jgi:hypothetical protein
MIHTLLGIAVLIYIWKNRDAVTELGSFTLKGVRWSLKLVWWCRHLALATALAICVVWAGYSASWWNQLAVYGKAHPERAESIRKDRMFYSDRVVLSEMKWLDAEDTRRAEEAKYPTFDEFLAKQRAEESKIPTFDEFVAKQPSEEAKSHTMNSEDGPELSTLSSILTISTMM